MATDYVDTAALKKTLSLDGSTYADDDVALAVTAASRWVDSYCDRRFWVDENPVARHYQAGAAGWTFIDDLAEVVSVEQGAAVAVEGYTLLPVNAPADERPYTMLTGVTGTVTVTGRFGWPAVPSPVAQASSLVAARLLKRSREAPFGVAGFSMEGAAVRIAPVDPDVASLLNPYQLKPQLVA